MWKLGKKLDLKSKSKKVDVPDNYFWTCKECLGVTKREVFEANNYVCPRCNYMSPIDAKARIQMVVDNDSFEEMFVEKQIVNPLNFKDYNAKQKTLQKNTNLDDALVVGKAKIADVPVVIGVMDCRFLMGSMGRKVGTKLTRAIELATRDKCTLILYTASGGARMQEGIISLMQMARTASALKKHHNEGLFYMPILTNPTTGGVTASFAMLGDIIVAEEKSLICFAGPRVIKETIKTELPEGFQKAEFLLEKGFLDAVIKRSEQKQYITNMVKIHDRRFKL